MWHRLTFNEVFQSTLKMASRILPDTLCLVLYPLDFKSACLQNLFAIPSSSVAVLEDECTLLV